jgi:hypothetical protein
MIFELLRAEYDPVPEPNDPGVASVYLQCISEPNANRGVCKDRAEWFGGL